MRRYVPAGSEVVPAFVLHGERAACNGADPRLFEGDGDDAESLRERNAQARKVCRPCPLKTACLVYALETFQIGVWGGTDGWERAGIRRREMIREAARRKREAQGAA